MQAKKELFFTFFLFYKTLYQIPPQIKEKKNRFPYSIIHIYNNIFLIFSNYYHPSPKRKNKKFRDYP